MPQDHQSVSYRRRQFVDAAIAVISREGVARATTRRIADVAQLPTASLHYCFATKEDLFHAVYEAITATGLAEVSGEVRQGVGLRQGLADITRSFAKWFQSSRDMQLATYELTMWRISTLPTNPVTRRIRDEPLSPSGMKSVTRTFPLTVFQMVWSTNVEST